MWSDTGMQTFHSLYYYAVIVLKYLASQKIKFAIHVQRCLKGVMISVILSVVGWLILVLKLKKLFNILGTALHTVWFLANSEMRRLREDSPLNIKLLPTDL